MSVITVGVEFQKHWPLAFHRHFLRPQNGFANRHDIHSVHYFGVHVVIVETRTSPGEGVNSCDFAVCASGHSEVVVHYAEYDGESEIYACEFFICELVL